MCTTLKYNRTEICFNGLTKAQIGIVNVQRYMERLKEKSVLFTDSFGLKLYFFFTFISYTQRLVESKLFTWLFLCRLYCCFSVISDHK